MLQRLTPDPEWAAGLVASLPALWQRDMLANWEREHKRDRTKGNLAHLKRANELSVVRVGLDATDGDLCTAAETLANRCFDFALQQHEPAYLEEAMRRVCIGQGIEPPDVKTTTHQGAIARMTNPMWWRRRLRRMHGRAVEKAAIDLGKVSRKNEIYASDQTVKRRAAQVARNEKTLETTIAINENGQEYTLAELAAKGTANKAIRRAELMTRIAGFERIARESGHEGLFLTITCPSRMHKMRTKGPKWSKWVEENTKYDGTTPREANQYLGKVWARIRAALARAEAFVYGFRIAEPQHDGTPHWHMLVFHQSGLLETLKKAIRKQALKDSPDEPGAKEHRCDFKPIDWKRGTAAGYIAKYVSKNIDGYRVEKDLYGNDCMTASQRVEAWSTTWGIRQFQQVGGPPVGPWRELRRIKEAPIGAPDYMLQAWEAVNKLTQLDGHPEKSVAWDRYIKAQGGVFVGRSYRVRVAMLDRPGMVNCYGEPALPVPYGVETWVRELYEPEHMQWMDGRGKAERVVHFIAESDRHAWEIKRAPQKVSIEGVSMGQGAAMAPWTRVNNCTEGGQIGTGRDAIGIETGAESVGWHESHDQDSGGWDVRTPDECVGRDGFGLRPGPGMPGGVQGLRH